VIAAALKWVDRRPEVDPLTGQVRTDPRTSGPSDADLAALEWALRLGGAWGREVVAVSAGPPEADDLLRDAVAAGAGRAVRVDLPADADAAAAAAALAPVLAAADVVWCGDGSLDRGTGAVPAFLAHALGAAQALGLVAVDEQSLVAVDEQSLVAVDEQSLVAVDEPGLVAVEGPGLVAVEGPGGRGGGLRVERRLDGGRRERLLVAPPAVLSVEAATARLRRAPLGAALAARRAVVEVVRPATAAGAAPHAPPVRTGPYRPRPRALPPPEPGLSARERVLALTGALVARTPPRTVTLDPEAAADLLLEQLRAWGERP
jgi:electron transfer flavoprotein beta subunit